MLLLSLFVSSTFVSAARQVNETPKVTGDQKVNFEKSKVETESKAKNTKTSLGDKKTIPIPLIPHPVPHVIPPRITVLLPVPSTPEGPQN